MRFGRYEILARLAAGGMGEVFRARLVGEAGFEKPVALKRVFAHLSEDPKYRELFVREAKVTARLVHPNIIQVYELGTHEGQLFIAMEFVDGTDFASLITHIHAQRNTPDLAVLAVVARDVLDALAFAHGFRDEDGTPRPIVHRDMSPQNILLSASGVAKVCDFGIARGALSEQSRTDILKGSSVGKRSFMPPEQALGAVVDRRADLFALGVTLWIAATGKAFYPDDAEALLLSGQRLQQRGLRDVWPDAPEDFTAIVDRAVQLDRDRRFQTADEFGQAIDLFLAQRGAAAARTALRELVHDMRHTVIQRSSAPEEPRQPESRVTMIEGTSYTAEIERPALPPPPAPMAIERTATVKAQLLTDGPTVTTTRKRPPRWIVPAALAAVAAILGALALREDELEPVPRVAVREIVAERPEPQPVSPPVETKPTPPLVASPAPEPTPAREPRPAPRPTKTERRAPVGYLTLDVKPPAHVRIDGRAVDGRTPLSRHPVPVGRRWITLEAANGKTGMIMVDIREGEVVTRSLTLE